MKCFEIGVMLTGTWEQEDPKGPSWWWGSGVYTIECRGDYYITFYVVAETEERAEEMVDKMDYYKIVDVEDIVDYEIDYIQETPECLTEDDTEESIEWDVRGPIF